MNFHRKIAVIGLGYIGLPVAIAFGSRSTVIGYDINPARINELRNGYDRTNEFTSEELKNSKVIFTEDPHQLANADFYIVAVPTPIDNNQNPDLNLLFNASMTIGQYLKPGDIVVYESTVYPGVTEEECLPILEKTSGLIADTDFAVGYSPERINPGDKKHTFTTITKVVAAQNEETLDIIANVYGSVIKAGIYRAASIKVAEAAKIIENTQRDLNIALINEAAIIFNKMNISTHAVLSAAETKWNFLPFKPGLVGGHCLGVDPYYLTHKAQKIGYSPEVILAGRKINDSMGHYIAEKTILKLNELGVALQQAKVAILGITFKENCTDIRNSRIKDIFKTLHQHKITTFITDPIADPIETEREYKVNLIKFDDINAVDAIIVAVSHQQYSELTEQDYLAKLNKPGLIIDVKNVIHFKSAHPHIHIWKL